jgi:hypothetical protein
MSEMSAVPVPSSPSSVLRQAAKLMRERAEKSTGGPWEPGGGTVDQAVSPYAEVISREVKCGTFCQGGTAVPPSEADAEHIASWHPAVALAVADVLEGAARSVDFYAHVPECSLPGFVTAALAVARAYLGTTEGTSHE